MPDYIETDNSKAIRWRKFIRKNLLMYLIPNILLNTCISYAAFIQQGSVHLFNGEQNLARFLLPMSLFVPFLITFDILKKAIELSAKGHIDFVLHENFRKNKFIFKTASLHALTATFSVTFFVFALYFIFSASQIYNPVFSAILVGSLAAFYAIFFPLLSIKKLRNQSVRI